MQAAWDTYGESAFSFGYAVKCDAEDILRFEQLYIDRLHPEFNTAKLAGTSLGTRRTDVQRERLRQRPQSLARKHNFRGEMLTVEEISRRTGLLECTVRARLRTGVSLEREKQNGAPQPVTVGDRSLTPRQIAKEFDLPLTTVYSRLRKGWSGSELIQPRKHRARNSKD